MSKLASEDKFIDLSDYGRPFGKWLANLLKNTFFTPIHVTVLFGICGLAAVYFILNQFYIIASILIILKSLIDAADGELARLKKTPSYVGRYLDSVTDIVLNLLFILAIQFVTKTNLIPTIVAFFCIQLQGTLYNYYYVILRNTSEGGDKTSKVFENKVPIALPGERQQSVNIMFGIYTIVYGVFDRIIYFLDREAYKTQKLPKWFMTFLSLYGLGFQLLIIAFMLTFNCVNYIIPFFIVYSIFIIVLIGIRKFIF